MAEEIVYDPLRRHVYRAMLHAAEQVQRSAYAEQLRKNRGRPLRQFTPVAEAVEWCKASGRLHKMTDGEVEGLLAEITTPANLERRFTPGSADKL